MKQWLKLTDDQRRTSLAQASQASGINVKSIEKDWWVTVTLKALFQSAHAKHLIFKGGTSLSKCWKLIERFSEDIDLALDPNAFNTEYAPSPSNNYLKKLREPAANSPAPFWLILSWNSSLHWEYRKKNSN